jgi:Rieske 2Fe-2S family protein
VAPLMGRFAAYDGGETALAAEPFTYMLAYNDHAVFFAFVPRDVDHTDIVCTWLGCGSAGGHWSSSTTCTGCCSS